MAGGVLLDTCALLWLMEEAPLETSAREYMDAAARNSNLWVSPISAWEVGVHSQPAQLYQADRVVLVLGDLGDLGHGPRVPASRRAAPGCRPGIPAS